MSASDSLCSLAPLGCTSHRRPSESSRSHEGHRGTPQARWLMSGPAIGLSRLPIFTLVQYPDGPERVRGRLHLQRLLEESCRQSTLHGEGKAPSRFIQKEEEPGNVPNDGPA